jgi:hypothetical protein
MTERVLPAISVGARPLARPTAVPRSEGVVSPARPVAHRREAILGTPARAGMLIGASAAVYAVTLAGVAALQAQADAETAARRAPLVEAAARTRAANDRLEAVIREADAQVRGLASEYASTTTDVTAYQARLDALAALVADVQGSAAALPTRIKLPAVTVHGAIARGSSGGARSAPATRSTTSASAKP